MILSLRQLKFNSDALNPPSRFRNLVYAHKHQVGNQSRIMMMSETDAICFKIIKSAHDRN